MPRSAILVERWDHVFPQRCQRLVAFLVGQQLLGFLPGRHVGMPVLGDDFKQFPLLGGTKTLFDFRDLPADFLADRLVLLVQLLFFLGVGSLEQLQRDAGVGD